MSTFKLFKTKISSTGPTFPVRVHSWNCLSTFWYCSERHWKKTFNVLYRRVSFEQVKWLEIVLFSNCRALRACSSCVVSFHFKKRTRNVQGIFHKHLLFWFAVKTEEITLKHNGKLLCHMLHTVVGLVCSRHFLLVGWLVRSVRLCIVFKISNFRAKDLRYYFDISKLK